jgi:hypothetical protein
MAALNPQNNTTLTLNVVQVSGAGHNRNGVVVYNIKFISENLVGDDPESQYYRLKFIEVYIGTGSLLNRYALSYLGNDQLQSIELQDNNNTILKKYYFEWAHLGNDDLITKITDSEGGETRYEYLADTINTSHFEKKILPLSQDERGPQTPEEWEPYIKGIGRKVKVRTLIMLYQKRWKAMS